MASNFGGAADEPVVNSGRWLFLDIDWDLTCKAVVEYISSTTMVCVVVFSNHDVYIAYNKIEKKKSLCMIISP